MRAFGSDRDMFILILRTSGMSQENVAGVVRCQKSRVGSLERTFRNVLNDQEAAELTEDQAIVRLIQRELVDHHLDKEVREKVSKITGEDVFRHYRLNRFSEALGIEQMALSGKQEDPRNQSSMRTGDPVYGTAKVNHVRKLIELAEQLEGQLQLPQPCDAGSWVPPQGQHYRLLAIHTGSHPVGLGPHYRWEPKECCHGIIHLAVEGDALYFPCLQAHIADQEVWVAIEERKTAGATYLSTCRQLVQAIVKECEARTRSKVLIEQEWPQEGIYWPFVERVYRHHTSLAQGYPGVDRIGYQNRDESEASGMSPTLWHGSVRIACHQDGQLLSQWKSIHEQLLAGNDWTANAQALAREWKKLDELAKPIRQVIRLEIERGTFGRGTCQLCPD